MNRRAIAALVRRDLTAVFRSRALALPLIVVPIVLSAVVPGLMALLPRFTSGPGGAAAELEPLLAALPQAIKAELAQYTAEQALIVLLAVYLLAPLFLIVPFMVSSVIAADSFAGERERGTLEALLYSPITDGELFLAKILVAWLPALLATALGFVTYAVVVNAVAWPEMGRVFFPNAMWFVLILWVAPAVAALGLAGMVFVSLRVKTVQEAVQLGGLLVVPILALMVGQIRGSMMLGSRALAVVGLVVWIVSGAVLLRGVRSFRRTKLISRA